MILTGADLLRGVLTLFLVILAYPRLGNVLRFLLPFRVRHEALPHDPAPDTTMTQALESRGFKFLGWRCEAIFRLQRRVAAIYVHANGQIVDVPSTGRLPGAYALTLYEGGRCALTRAGTGRDVITDRYRSRTVSPSKTLRDLLETHAESEAGVSLGDPVRRITTLEQRLSLGEEWYREHARTELLIPATLDGLLLLAFVVFGVYLWTL